MNESSEHTSFLSFINREKRRVITLYAALTVLPIVHVLILGTQKAPEQILWYSGLYLWCAALDRFFEIRQMKLTTRSPMWLVSGPFCIMCIPAFVVAAALDRTVLFNLHNTLMLGLGLLLMMINMVWLIVRSRVRRSET